tara:strand:+ start:7839 stop:7952 length:114 start_codon:yes stop_codon:yes gene_type:complete
MIKEIELVVGKDYALILYGYMNHMIGGSNEQTVQKQD